MRYLPHTEEQVQRMLATVGVATTEELFDSIPRELRLRSLLNVPPPMSEIELRGHFRTLADANRSVAQQTCFLGAGLYDHYVPAMIATVVGRSEFATAYTPYQPEMSQGTLQTIYEFQTMVSYLTGTDVANASMYDGATALAEAVIMAQDITGRTEVVMARSVHPSLRRVTRTYVTGLDTRLREVTAAEGRGTLDPATLAASVTDATACLVVQQPNFFGCIEAIGPLAEAAHARGALLVVAADPIALGLLRAPGAEGADIVVGEGQPLGLGLNYGGPLVGLFACRKEYMRRMPGRLVGATRDGTGQRGFTLTLQTREQHIRRAKATSNICTNQGLCMTAATAYLAVMGKAGLRQVAELCLQKAHYARDRILALPGYSAAFAAPFFKEFAVRGPRPPREINARLRAAGILGGYELGHDYPELADALLFCVTEKRTRGEIDHLVEVLGSG
jgi:glycine cleavage system P protein (glycine dehydrogenase) subunit 1